MPSKGLDPAGGQGAQVYLFNSEVTVRLALAKADVMVFTDITHASGL